MPNNNNNFFLLWFGFHDQTKPKKKRFPHRQGEEKQMGKERERKKNATAS